MEVLVSGTTLVTAKVEKTIKKNNFKEFIFKLSNWFGRNNI